MPIYDNIVWFVLSIALCGFDVIEWSLFGLVTNFTRNKNTDTKNNSVFFLNHKFWKTQLALSMIGWILP